MINYCGLKRSMPCSNLVLMSDSEDDDEAVLTTTTESDWPAIGDSSQLFVDSSKSILSKLSKSSSASESLTAAATTPILFPATEALEALLATTTSHKADDAVVTIPDDDADEEAVRANDDDNNNDRPFASSALDLLMGGLDEILADGKKTNFKTTTVSRKAAPPLQKLSSSTSPLCRSLNVSPVTIPTLHQEPKITADILSTASSTTSCNSSVKLDDSSSSFDVKFSPRKRARTSPILPPSAIRDSLSKRSSGAFS